VPETALPFTEQELHHWKLLDRFREKLLPHLPSDASPPTQLTQQAYFSLFLFRLLNPVITSMRGLCAATSLARMKQVLAQPVAPSSFSEAQHLFSPEILAGVVRDLATQARGRMQFGDDQVRQAVKALTLVDGTLLRAVHRMVWTPQDSRRCAVRLHLHFSAFDQVPVDWSITPGTVSEVKEWKKKIQPGGFYVVDRLYCQDLLYLKKLQKDGVDFVVRLRDNITRTAREAPRPLTPEDVKAGVLCDQREELGQGGGGPEVSSGHHPHGFAGPLDRIDLSLSLADRALFQMDQNPAALRPLAGGVSGRGQHSNPQHFHRGPAPDAGRRTAPQQTGNGSLAVLLDRFYLGQGTGPSPRRSKKETLTAPGCPHPRAASGRALSQWHPIHRFYSSP
jgi:hypothetical protein